jgi:creatinine amidohydrolase
VLPPADAKHRVDLAGVAELSPERHRERLGDGSFGGAYERSDADMLSIWDVAIEETREVLSEGW